MYNDGKIPRAFAEIDNIVEGMIRVLDRASPWPRLTETIRRLTSEACHTPTISPAELLFFIESLEPA